MQRRLPALAILTCTIVAAPAIARAQAAADPPAAVEVAGGYSVLTELGKGPTSSTTYPTGWFITAGRPVGWPWLVWSGEISVNARTNLAIERQRLVAFLGGAHVPLIHAGRLRAYASALAGVERFSEPGFNESGFAFQPGAGLDIRLWQALGARVQADYRIAWQDTGTYKDVRVIAGAAIRLGGR